MIKPKTQQFRLKFMLIKLEAVINRVSTRCHASLKIGTSHPIQTMNSSFSKLPPNSRKIQHSSTVK